MMTATVLPSIELPLHRRARWLLIAMHVPFIIFTTAQGGFALAFPDHPDHTLLAFAMAAAAGGLQLRHSLSSAAGIRPRYWRWSLLLIVALAWIPIPVFGLRWATLEWYVLASFAMLLPGTWAVSVSVATALSSSIWFAIADTTPDSAPLYAIWAFCYWSVLQFLGAIGLYGATRLVRLMDELRDARSNLAELAVERERLRISRDLHDLLGQSLSAVSLKGDLAIGLLERGDARQAATEIESITAVARSTLHDLLDVPHREPPIALSAEIERAADLLAATGTETRLDVQAERLSPSVDELFAWALREGVTNVLRHSTATTCSIRIDRTDSVVRLEIVNDGALPISSNGTGLSGLAARAARLSGVANGQLIGDGRFRLRVEVPEVRA